MLGILIGAALLGGIIMLMNEGDFPGWGCMIGCVLAAIAPVVAFDLMLPSRLFFVGQIVGAACAALAISAICGMTIGRAVLVAGIWLAAEVLLALGLQWAAS